LAQKVLIRAAAGPRVGAGHAMRCLALAQACQEQGGEVVFVMQPGFHAVEEKITKSKIPIYHTHDGDGGDEDVRQTLKTANQHGTDWIVVDGYDFGVDYQRQLKQAGHGLVWMDDYAHAAIRYADIVINQNIHTDRSMYLNSSEQTVFLLGTDFAMLRSEFRCCSRSPKKDPSGTLHLLVTLGGGDHEALVLKTIESLGGLKRISLEVSVVAGLVRQQNTKLAEAAASCRHPVRLIHDAQDMPGLMRWADVAVSAAGSTCWELAYLGVPHLMIVIAENQRRIAEGLHHYGSGISLGWFEDCSSDRLTTVLQRVCEDESGRRQMAERGRKLIDGQGVFRIIEKMKQIEVGGAHPAKCDRDPPPHSDETGLPEK